MAKVYFYDDLSNIIQRDLDRIRDFHEIPDDIIPLKPDPSSWSTVEILMHLINFNKLYISKMDKAVDSKHLETTENDSFKPRFIFRQIIRFFEPPYRVKVKTVAPMSPELAESENPTQIIQNLAGINQSLIRRIEMFKEKELDLNRIKGENPVLQWISMSLVEFILVLDAHQRRHFWQIEQTLLKISGEKD